jgi:DNA-binding beta-propeller fold protein YncE
VRVSLAQPHRLATLEPPRPLLAPAGARVILGGTDALAEPVRPAAHTLFGPRGVAMAETGAVFVCDTGHHRVLVWRETPTEDLTPADFAIGQPDLASEGRRVLNVPTGIAVVGDVLAVADAWNHRILLWHGLPTRRNQLPDVILGGLGEPAADTLNWCYGVAIDDGRLYVADTGNRRVLVWDSIPQASGTPANRVIGQPGFTTRDLGDLRWPHGLAVAGERLFIADAGTSRIVAGDLILGQDGPAGADHNRGAYDPTAASLNMPYGIAVLGPFLVAADTANSRLVGYDLTELETGMAADRLAGQRWFHDKGENRWERTGRDTLCWPYGVATCGDTMLIADSGNNRVMLWDAA